MGRSWRERSEEERREMVAEALKGLQAILERPEVRTAIEEEVPEVR